MIGHAADPDILKPVGSIKGDNDFQGMVEIVVKTVENDIAQPCTDE